MAKKIVNHIKLGLFVLAGLLFLIITLYMIGKDQNLFGNTFVLKTRFPNVQGLVPGNSVRYAGIEVGTVRSIDILNDTLIEVRMTIRNRMQPFIKKNAITAIGTDGLMGNRVINIEPKPEQSVSVAEEDVLISRAAIRTDEMLRTLEQTNRDVAIVAENLKATVIKINNSSALWQLLHDQAVPQDIRTAASNIRQATTRASLLMGDLQDVVADFKAGKGSLGAIVRDTLLAMKLSETIDRMDGVGEEASRLLEQLQNTMSGVDQDLRNGKGTLHALLRDSGMVIKLNKSLTNIEQGTDAFNQNMEAMKHHFLFRGYFRKQEKEKQKSSKQGTAQQ